MNVYSIYDQASEAYGRPFFQRAHGEALRSFERLIQDPQTEFHVKPSDFTLFYIGEFDDKLGTLHPEPPTLLGNGIEYQEPNPDGTQISNGPPVQ